MSKLMDIAQIKQIIQLLDFTDLSDGTELLNATDPALLKQMIAFCNDATTSVAPIAAVCVYQQCITTVKQLLGDKAIPVATVVNFPRGDQCIEDVELAIQQSLALHADELDVVLPRHLIGKKASLKAYLTRCKIAANGHCLKIILETGALTPEQIIRATHMVCDIGADFIKTSTGKYKDPITHEKKGATLEAVNIILSVLKTRQQEKQPVSGIKISGGVTLKNILSFLNEIEKVMGAEWIHKKNVRIGASATGLSPFAILNSHLV